MAAEGGNRRASIFHHDDGSTDAPIPPLTAHGAPVLRTLASRLMSAVEGLTAEEVALVLALGLLLGTFPMAGLPTLLCALAAGSLRVNFPALQLVNNLSSPLQIAL